jgi:hypothetical protein
MILFIQWLKNHLMACPYKAVTGIDCPGCGMQRSFIELVQGNLRESFSLYPALIPVIFTLAITFLHLLFKFRNGAMLIKYSFIISISIITITYIIKLLK